MAPQYLPVRLIRLIKAVIIICPLLASVSLLILVLDTIARENRKENERRIKEDLYTNLEKISYCQQRADGWNDIPETDLIKLNATVVEFCKVFEQSQKTFFSRRPHKVNVFNHTIIKGGHQVCQENAFIVVLVHSLHSYRDRRDAIRQTWGGAIRNGTWPTGPEKHPPNDAQVMFVFGQHIDAQMESSLEEESRIHGDIIQGDFGESYRNMTLKSLLGLKWALEFCPHVKYLFKCDDDMFVNMAAIVNFLQKSPISWSIMGPLNQGSRVYRVGKWGLTKEQYPFYYFPPYESGSGYAISGDLIQPLLETSTFVPWIFIDDVYITGILGKILEVNHVIRKGFAYWTSKAPSACEIAKGSVLTGTRVNPKLQLDIWKQLTGGIRCHNTSTIKAASTTTSVGHS